MSIQSRIFFPVMLHWDLGSSFVLQRFRGEKHREVEPTVTVCQSLSSKTTTYDMMWKFKVFVACVLGVVYFYTVHELFFTSDAPKVTTKKNKPLTLNRMNSVPTKHSASSAQVQSSPNHGNDMHHEGSGSQQPLPDGWEEKTAKDGRKYYENSKTKTEQWNRPESNGGTPKTSNVKAVIPPTNAGVSTHNPVATKDGGGKGEKYRSLTNSRKKPTPSGGTSRKILLPRGTRKKTKKSFGDKFGDAMSELADWTLI
eukprot:882220_1